MNTEIKECLKQGYTVDRPAGAAPVGDQFVDGVRWHPHVGGMSLHLVVEAFEELLEEQTKIYRADLDLCDKDLAEARHRIYQLERKLK